MKNKCLTCRYYHTDSSGEPETWCKAFGECGYDDPPYETFKEHTFLGHKCDTNSLGEQSDCILKGISEVSR